MVIPMQLLLKLELEACLLSSENERRRIGWRTGVTKEAAI